MSSAAAVGGSSSRAEAERREVCEWNQWSVDASWCKRRVGWGGSQIGGAGPCTRHRTRSWPDQGGAPHYLPQTPSPTRALPAVRPRHNTPCSTCMHSISLALPLALFHLHSQWMEPRAAIVDTNISSITTAPIRPQTDWIEFIHWGTRLARRDSMPCLSVVQVFHSHVVNQTLQQGSPIGRPSVHSAASPAMPPPHAFRAIG